MDVSLVIIVVLTILFFASIVTYTFLYNREKKLTEYYSNILTDIINATNLIDESFATLAAAYGVEEGDLRNFIVRRQDELTKSGK